MIVSYKHKGLELYALKGDRSRLPSAHINKIRLILSSLDVSTSLDQMNQPGYNFHTLKGYSGKVSGNWRIIFSFEGENAKGVDFIDYY